VESGKLEKIFEAREKKGITERRYTYIYSTLQEDDQRKKLNTEHQGESRCT
jgi:hypothetical protein